jgi:AAA family ATP:ADP antiporter
MPDSEPRLGVPERLGHSLGIRPGEWESTLLLSLQLMLAIGSVICLKAAADSLFLADFEASRLPWVDLSITALVGAVVGVYLRLSNRVSLGLLIGASQIFLALNLLLFWLLMRWGVPFIPALLYVWVGIFGVLIPSQVWTLAGTVFDTRQAKRLFSLIGSGGIMGAALGGQCASILGPMFGTENLLLVTMALVLACASIVFRITSVCPRPEDGARTKDREKTSLRQTFDEVHGTSYLRLISLALFLSTIVGTLVKYQFKAIAKTSYEGDPTAMVSFFGDFYGYVAVFSFLFHILLSGRLLRWLGLGMTIFILPVSLFFGAGALLFSTALGAAILARGSDQAFRHSVDRAAVELLYVPLSQAVRTRVKSFLDMVVSRSADGVASLVLILLISLLHFDVGQISWVALGVVVVWLAVNWRLRGAYVSTLRGSIERKDVSPEQLLRSLAQSSPEQQIEGTLQSGDLRAVETAVDWIQFSGVGAEQAQLAALLTHESSAIRRKTMAIVAANQLPNYEREALRYLELEPDVEGRWEALQYLDSRDGDVKRAELTRLLSSPDRSLAAAVAACLLNHPGDGREQIKQGFVDYIRESRQGDKEARATAARLIGLAPPQPELQEDLSAFLNDKDDDVVRAALQSAASYQPQHDLPKLLESLADRRYRPEARSALAAYGEPILSRLNRSFLDPTEDTARRQEIPRVMSLIGGPAAARLLLDDFETTEGRLRLPLIRALDRIRQDQPDLRFEHDRVNGLINDELRRYYEEAVLLGGIPDNGGSRSVGFLRRALTEHLELRLQGVFRLLTLIYPRNEILDAYHWIMSGRPDLRSNALEFLDSRVDLDFRPVLLSAAEHRKEAQILEDARTHFEFTQLPYSVTLRHLLEARHPWVQACTCYVVSDAGMPDLMPWLDDLRRSHDPLLAETARFSFDRMAESRDGGGA